VRGFTQTPWNGVDLQFFVIHPPVTGMAAVASICRRR
jgi:hypothetical protein